MQILSTNIGEKKKINWQGTDIYTGIYKYPVEQSIYLGTTDVKNDDVIDRRYHGGLDKACYLYSADHYAFWKELFPNSDWEWGMFGENLTIESLDESKIYIGDIYKIGKVIIQVTQPRQPCFKLGVRLNNNLAVKRFIEAEMPGVYVRVLEPGDVKASDNLELIDSKPENFTIKEIYHFLYHSKKNIENIRKAILIPELAESCKKDLIKAIK